MSSIPRNVQVLSVGVFLLALSLVLHAQDQPRDRAILLISPRDAQGLVRIVAKAGDFPDQALGIRARSSGGGWRMVAEQAVGEFTDRPPEGEVTVYALFAGERELLRKEVDLRIKPRLVFLGGTAKRGVFRWDDRGSSQLMTVAVGGRIEYDGFAPDGTPQRVDTGFTLAATELLKRGVTGHRATPLALPSGEPLLGLDGKQLAPVLLHVEGDARRVVRVTVKKDGKTFALAEGEGIDG